MYSMLGGELNGEKGSQQHLITYLVIKGKQGSLSNDNS